MSRILLFDSGVGGLSILKKLRTHLPNSEYHYFADHQAAPYGEKDDDWLNQRINTLVSNLNKKLSPDVIIIACNTASTLSLKALRSSIQTNIIGVVPAIKTAAEKAGSQPIGLLATPATIDRDYTNGLIEDFSKHKAVIKVGISNLVSMAESKLSGIEFSTVPLHKILEPFIQNNCHHIVLGCTHFPLLIEELSEVAPHINWIDSGSAIAKRTEDLLKTIPESNLEPISRFYSSSTINPGLEKFLFSMGFKYLHSNHSTT